jgi:hypothetical protein
MAKVTGFLNCYERDELEQWLDDVEDLAYADDDNIDDNDLTSLYYPERLQ